MIGLSTSCQKELAGGQEPAGNKPFTITASIADSGTKVSYAEDGDNNLTPSWVVGDVIIGFDGDGNTYGYSVTEVNTETKKATLEIIASGANAGGKTVNPANGTKMYMFYAPGKTPSAINTTDKSLTVSLASQDKDVVPALMMASATVTNSSLSLEFENKTAIIGVKTPVMAAAGKAYTSVALSGTGINTEVVFSLSGETLQASYQTAGTITKTLDFTSDASTQKGPDVIYIVACPLASAADLTFTFNGNEEYFKVAGATMEAGHYYYMTPTTGKQKFSITVDGSIANGSISTDKTEGTCAWGETVTVTATPATGYELATLTYTDSSDHDILSAKSFTMPKANVTVSGTFTPISYTLTGTPSPTEGGTVTFKKGTEDATSAHCGDEITIINTASDDYVISSVSAVDASSNPVTITDGKFTMPASNVTVTTTFAKKSFSITSTPVAITGGSFKVKKGDDEVTSAPWGETIKVEVTKPQYYAVDKIKVYKTGDTSVTVSVNADGMFTMPKHDVTIEVTFIPDGSAPPTEMPETIGL